MATTTNTFTGRVALVTGGGSGIGRATCLLLARDGASVVVTDLSVEAARKTLTLMPNPAVHLALHMDVTQKSSVEAVIAGARERFGAVPSLLVNSAGVTDIAFLVDVKERSFDQIIDVNLKGTFLVTQALVKALLEKNTAQGEEVGAVVNIASLAGKTGTKYSCHYAAAKGGVIAFSKSCAAELARKGVRVNCVLPGLIDTPMASSMEPHHNTYKSKNPLGRLGKSEEVAEAVVFLLSRRSSYVVGACLVVSGGTDM